MMRHSLDLTKVLHVIFVTFRWLSVGFFLVSSFALAKSLWQDYPLMTRPVKVDGIITDFHMHDPPIFGNQWLISFAYQVPVVTYQGDKGISHQVESRYGDNNAALGMSVPVLFDGNNPDNAIVDHGVLHNWLTEYVWLFVSLFSLMGIRRFSSAREAASIEKITRHHHE